MADVQKNTGTAQRFKEGTIEISGGTDQYILMQRVHGTFRFTEGGFAMIPISNNGSLDENNIRQGDEQPTTMEIQFYLTKEGMTGSNDLYDLVKPSFTAGKADTFEVIVDIPDAPGSSTGTKFTFAHCVLNAGGLSVESVDGEDCDKVSLSLTDYEAAPAKATY